ncbi:unnamed protein product [Scytosiphon promiscuus]
MEANVTELWQAVEALQLELDSMGTDMDAFWLMLGAVLVIFMQAGFAMLEVGSVGAKHTKNLLVKNLLDLAVAGIMWWSFGWGIAFGESNEETGRFNQFAGPGSFFTRGDLFEDSSGSYGNAEGYSWALWLFQWSFSGAAVTIVSGAAGERICMSGYFIFAQVMVGFIYPVAVRMMSGIAHQTYRECLLLVAYLRNQQSAIATEVHATGGVAALVVVVLLGPRLERFSDKGVGRKMERQSVIMQTLGAFILWVGWFGFNGCSTLYITGSSHVAAKAMVMTTLSASSAGLGVASVSSIMFQHVGPDQVINGLLSGLVAITAGCAVVEAEGAFLIGAIAAIVYLGSARLLELVRIDDMVDAAPVHLANGVWGVLAAGLFASEEGYSASYYEDRGHRCCGLFYGCGSAQLMANLSLILAILGWTGLTTFAIASFVKFLGILRISNATERMGTDSVAHGGTELPEFAKNMLSRIEMLAAKAAIDVSQDGTGSSSSRPHHRSHIPSRRPKLASSISMSAQGR